MGAGTQQQTLEIFVMAAITNPDKIRIAQEELDRVFGRDRLTTCHEGHWQLPYISETMEELG